MSCRERLAQASSVEVNLEPLLVTGQCEPSGFACWALRVLVCRVNAGGAITAFASDSWWQ